MPNRELPWTGQRPPRTQPSRTLAAADSDLALAESTLKRYQNLYDKKSVSPQEFDEVKARYQAALAQRDMTRAGQAQAKAALAQARTSFEYTRIRAPFDGVITEKKADPGTLASPGLPHLHGRGPAPLSPWRPRSMKNDLRYVRMGQQVPVVVDALEDAGLKGKVVQIVPAADPAQPQFPGEDRTACRSAPAFGPVRTGTVFPRRAVVLRDSANRSGGAGPTAGRLRARPEPGRKPALRHGGKTIRG